MNVLAGLVEAGSVDLFCSVAERPDLPEGSIPPPPGLRRAFVHRRRRFEPTAAGIGRWVFSRLPRAVAWIDWRDAGVALGDWASQPYDLVWFSHCHVWLALEGRRTEPTIVDLDNLEDERIETWRRVRRLQAAEAPSRSYRARLRGAFAERLDRIDAARWRRAQSRAAADARAVIVCSDLDRSRLGVESAVVIPNGYEPDGEPRRVPSADATLTTVGLMIYPPNSDGARFFATRVLPLVREEVPDARFRIVGHHHGEVADLAHLPGVEVVGEVDDVSEVLASSTAVVVPLRAGSGTRVKVIEAFAQGVPVVSTTLGCEGLGARDGEHLLIGDTPEELARACVRVIRDPELAKALVEHGHHLWASRYRAENVRAQTTRIAREAAG